MLVCIIQDSTPVRSGIIRTRDNALKRYTAVHPAAHARLGQDDHDYMWQQRMKGEVVMMDVEKAQRSGKMVFPAKDVYDRVPSCRYLRSVSATASTYCHDCACYPGPRCINVPTRLRADPQADLLTELVAQRRYASYTAFLHNAVDPRSRLPLPRPGTR